MITAKKMIYDFYLKKNGLNTGQGQNYKIKDIVSLINESWFRIFENNVQKAELNRRFEENVRHLKVKHKSLAIKKEDTNYSLAKYPKNLYKRLNQKAVVSCDYCGDCSKEIIIRIPQSDDLNEALKNPYKKANFGWEQLLGEQGKDGLYVYHDDLKVEKVIIDYYRKPRGIVDKVLSKCNKSIDYLGDLENATETFEVDNTSIASKVIDGAILLSNAATMSPQEFTLNFNKITSFDNIT